MAMAGVKGFLLVMMDCPPILEDEFNAWYDTEHLPERLGVPGFLTALRFICRDGHPKYLAMYDLERPDVLETPAYLKVAHDQSSPWTKRVTSRVRVYRSAGAQIYPSSPAETRRAARVTVLRFRGVVASAETAIVEGMRANFEGRPETLQTRVLAYKAGSATDYLGFVEASAPFSGTLDTAKFGKAAASLDLVNSYASY